MSRGYGELQRQLLTILTEHGGHRRPVARARYRGAGESRAWPRAHARRGGPGPARAGRADAQRRDEDLYELRASALLGQGAGSARTSGLTCSRGGLILVARR